MLERPRSARLSCGRRLRVSPVTGSAPRVYRPIERRGIGANRQKICRKYRQYEQTAGPFDRLRAGSSTSPLAMRLRETPLRMTIFLYPSITEVQAICRCTPGQPILAEILRGVA